MGRAHKFSSLMTLYSQQFPSWIAKDTTVTKRTGSERNCTNSLSQALLRNEAAYLMKSAWECQSPSSRTGAARKSSPTFLSQTVNISVKVTMQYLSIHMVEFSSKRHLVKPLLHEQLSTMAHPGNS